MTKSMSFIDAAYQLLKESGEPRHYRWLTEEAIRRGLIATKGKTPEATMYASLPRIPFTNSIQTGTEGESHFVGLFLIAPRPSLPLSLNHLATRMEVHL